MYIVNLQMSGEAGHVFVKIDMVNDNDYIWIFIYNLLTNYDGLYILYTFFILTFLDL
jgi:hypothetical protein